MVRRFSFTLLAGLFGAVVVVVPAIAQFGGIFGNDPPRPPQGVPGRPLPPEEPPPRPQNLPPPPRPLPQVAPQGPQGGVQSLPLPPPPGSATAPSAPAQPPVSGLPPGRPPRGAPPQPADTTPQPGDEVVAEPPAKKVPNPTGIFAGLDKITGRITSFDVAMNETVQFGALQVTPRACYTRPPTETPHTDAFIEVDEVTLQGEIRRIYTGWMFAASPGLHAVEHPIYDIWLTDCKGGVVAEAAEPAQQAARPPQQRNQPNPQQQRAQPGQQPPPQQQPRRPQQPF